MVQLILTSAAFVATSVANGGVVNVRLRWSTTADASVLLHFDPAQFEISPAEIAIDADAAGDDTFPLTIRRKTAATKHCDVSFQLGNQVHASSVEVG